MNRGILSTALGGTLALLALTAHGVPVTDPDDGRNWQSAKVGDFASARYGSNTLANRKRIVDFANGGANSLLDDGTFNTAGLNFGAYYGKNLGCSGSSNADGTFGYSCGSVSDATYAANVNDLDWKWSQDTGNGGSSWTQGQVWDLGGPSNQAVVFPIIDHAPLPGEALEYSVYLSNNKFATALGTDGTIDWVLADLDKVYLEGWDATQIADGFTTVWRLPNQQTFRYVNVFAGGLSPFAFVRDGDDEIDAVAGLTFAGDPVGAPEPSTIVLLALGLAGIGFRRRQIH